MNKKVCSSLIDVLNFNDTDKTELAKYTFVSGGADYYKTGYKKWWEKSARARTGTTLTNFTDGVLVCDEFDKRIVLTELDVNIDDYFSTHYDDHSFKYQIVTLHKDILKDSSTYPLLNKKYYYSKQLQDFDFVKNDDGSVTENISNWMNSNKVHYSNLNYVKPKNYGMWLIYKIEKGSYLDSAYVLKYKQPHILGDIRFIYTDFLI